MSTSAADPASSPPLRSRRPAAVALSLRDVSAPAGRGRRSRARIDRISADLCEGQLTAIVAGTAETRSRLLAIAAGIEVPAAGTVLTGGHLHRGLGDPRASLLRTGEAILLSGASRKRGLNPLRRRPRPPALDHAGARRQREAVAAAIAADPLILFADLDPAGAAAAVAAIAAWVGGHGRTAVVAAGDPRAAAGADRVLAIGVGTLAADLEHPDAAELEELAAAVGSAAG
jgi:putative ABC transport system ATP-binding protein